MACFIVPAAEAVIVTAAKKMEEHKAASDSAAEEVAAKVPFSRKLGWLRNLLCGGAGLLAFEHVWHGEVVPFPPFLTAMYDPADTAEMLHEMGTVGVTMAILVTGAWMGMCAVADVIVKRPEAAKQEA